MSCVSTMITMLTTQFITKGSLSKPRVQCQYQTYRPVTSEGIATFQSSLCNIDWNYLHDHSIPLDMQWSFFLSALVESMEVSLPLRTFRTGTQRRKSWFSKELYFLHDRLLILKDLAQSNIYPSALHDLQKYKQTIKKAKKSANDRKIDLSTNPQKAS